MNSSQTWALDFCGQLDFMDSKMQLTSKVEVQILLFSITFQCCRIHLEAQMPLKFKQSILIVSLERHHIYLLFIQVTPHSCTPATSYSCACVVALCSLCCRSHVSGAASGMCNTLIRPNSQYAIRHKYAYLRIIRWIRPKIRQRSVLWLPRSPDVIGGACNTLWTIK
jgi:hypothetical protein